MLFSFNKSKNELGYYIEKYDIWSSYKPEDEWIFIACSSIHGNTMEAAKELKIFRRKETIYSLIVFCLFSFIVFIPDTRHFQRKNNVNRRTHFSA